MPSLKDRAGVIAAITAGIVALVAFGLPLRLGLVVAALIGMGVGMSIEMGKRRRSALPGKAWKGERCMTTTMALWLILLCIGILTYATRLSFILLFGKAEVPVLLQHALRFVPIAVLSAIILPALLIHDNALYLSLHNIRLMAGIVATGVAWRTKNILLTIIAGVAVLWLLQLILK